MSESKLTCSGGAVRSCAMSSEGGDGGSNCKEDQSIISGNFGYRRDSWTFVLNWKCNTLEEGLKMAEKVRTVDFNIAGGLTFKNWGTRTLNKIGLWGKKSVWKIDFCCIRMRRFYCKLIVCVWMIFLSQIYDSEKTGWTSYEYTCPLHGTCSCNCKVMWKFQINADLMSCLLFCDGQYTPDSHRNYRGKFLNPLQKDAIVRSVKCDINATASKIMRNMSTFIDLWTSRSLQFRIGILGGETAEHLIILSIRLYLLRHSALRSTDYKPHFINCFRV